jgi:hypothetical protein
MTMLVAPTCALLLAILAPAPSPAGGPAPKASPAPAPAPVGSEDPEPTGASDPAEPEPSGDVTRYSFTGLDIDGELRTPALLQFLARIAGEFETVGIPHRSFMPELLRTAASDAL